MRKVLLAAVTVAMVASLSPAHAASATYTRTIVAPTQFGGTEGAIAAPDVAGNPTNPNAWRKMGVSTLGARCGYLKQAEGVLPAGSAQDATSGKLGYVVSLPSGFTTGDTFSLTAATANAQFDFDVIFYTSLGKCASDREVSAPAGAGCVIVPLEGPRPQPDARIQDEAPAPGSCPDNGGKKSAFTKIGNESGTVNFNANYAIVVMPAGANGVFTLTVAGF